MKKFRSILLLCSFSLCACSEADLDAAAAKALAAGQTAENVLETVNVATGGLLTTAAANYALKLTHNTGDQAVVDAAIAEATATEKVQLAAKASGVTDPVALQTVTTGALTSSAVLAAGVQAAANSGNSAAAPAAISPGE